MVEIYRVKENSPFPNHPLPVIYYPKAVEELLDADRVEDSVINLFKENEYTGAWVNGIHPYHHFHSNTHEVLACIAGRGTVQMGGAGSDEYPFKKGDVVLLPAGVAHKLVDSTDDFQVIGAYPNGLVPDLQTGDDPDYEAIQQKSYDVLVPEKDPLSGSNGAVQEHWAL